MPARAPSRLYRQNLGRRKNSHDRKHDGTGLGLPVAKGLMELHGGTLEIESMKAMAPW